MRVTLLAGLVAVVSGCGETDGPDSCQGGEAAARSNQFPVAIDLLTRCVAQDKLDSSVRSRSLEIRAWSYSQLENDALAVSDQEAAFALAPQPEYRSLINYAGYLRRVNRFEDSLRAVRSAAE